MNRFTAAFPLCAVTFAAGLSLHAQAFPDTAFAASAAQLKALSATVPPTKTYGVQILLEEGRYKFAADGTKTYRHRLIYRVDAEESVKGWAEISSGWDPWFEKPVQLHARVLQPNGRFAELDQKTVTDAPVKADDAESYSSERERRAPLPGVAVGSIIEEEEFEEDKTPYFAGGELIRFRFRENVPMARSRLVVDLPAGVPFKDLVHNLPQMTVTRTEAEGRRHIVYEAANLPADHASDIDLDTNTPTRPTVEFSTGASWATLAHDYAALADPQTVTADAQPILPANLPPERMAKIRAIVARLHKEVRYTGVEFGAAKLTPQRPSLVIERHYGDCKDKATLLVAMLRAAGIPANLALISTGPGSDVDATLPGISQFDHAIVYVPAAGKEAALWIDATAQYDEVGSLPRDDEDRMALVIAPETSGLTRTWAMVPEGSVLIETRTFKLAELGPSQVEETSETHGAIDAYYRSEYGGTETPRLRENMERYVKNAYLARKLTTLSHGDGTDFTHPFVLGLTADGARRGFSAMSDAVVVIYPTGTLQTLPKWFAEAPPVLAPDAAAEERHDVELQKASRAATYSFHPFIAVQQIRIVIPPGFAVRALPQDKTTPLGTASLSESYKAEGGTVRVTFRFNSGPGTLTAEQALALRDAVLELNKREYVGINFDQTGAKALAAGKFREALEADRALIAAHPDDALNHVRLARALLEAGIGNEAQKEARRATDLDPRSSAAYETLGWTLEHDNLGVRFGKNYDLPGAVAAFRKAMALDAENDDAENDAAFDLGILLEFDARGIRYAADADLAGAIREYRGLMERNKDKGDAAVSQFRENLLYCLLYAHQFAELDKLLATLPSSNNHTTLAISSAVAQHGVPAGIAAAEKGNTAAADRNQNLRSAGGQLARMRMYPQSAAILNAGMQGAQDAAATARQAELYGGLKEATLTPLPATNPASPVQRVLFGMMAGTLTRGQVEGSLSRHAYAAPAGFERDVEKNLRSSGFLKIIATKSDTSETVLLDMLAGNTTFTSTGDDAHGFSVVAQMPGSEPIHYFVVKEDGQYRAVADNNDNTQVGNQALYALAHNQPAQAKALLDWKRDLTHKQGGDDPYAGPLLPRFWTIASSKPGADSPEAMRLAAVSLLAGAMDAKPFLGELATAREQASGPRQTDLDLLLASAAAGAEDAKLALAASQRLLEQEPDSLTALSLAGQAYALQHDAQGWQAMLAPRLAKKPTDHDALLQQARAQEMAADWKDAASTRRKVIATGKADSSDYNSLAWLALFAGKPDEAAVKAAQDANSMTRNANFSELHTLACVYAAAGRTTEARQVLAQAMYAGSQSEPSSPVWYALGLIYEQYGEKAAALDAYSRVQAHELDDHTFVEPTSTYVLARERVVALGGK